MRSRKQNAKWPYKSFTILNLATGEMVVYPYISGWRHQDSESVAIQELMALHKKPRSCFVVYCLN